VDRPRCYAGNRDVEVAIMSGSGSTLIMRPMQLQAAADAQPEPIVCVEDGS
jgi:hypothetical protein